MLLAGPHQTGASVLPGGGSQLLSLGRGAREALAPKPRVPLPRKPLEVLVGVPADTLGSPSTHT